MEETVYGPCVVKDDFSALSIDGEPLTKEDINGQCYQMAYLSVLPNHAHKTENTKLAQTNFNTAFQWISNLYHNIANTMNATEEAHCQAILKKLELSNIDFLCENFFPGLFPEKSEIVKKWAVILFFLEEDFIQPITFSKHLNVSMQLLLGQTQYVTETQKLTSQPSSIRLYWKAMEAFGIVLEKHLSKVHKAASQKTIAQLKKRFIESVNNYFRVSIENAKIKEKRMQWLKHPKTPPPYFFEKFYKDIHIHAPLTTLYLGMLMYASSHTEALLIDKLLHDHVHFQYLMEATVNLVRWPKDIYSLRKNIKEFKYENLVLVKRYYRKLTLKEAVQQTLEDIKSEVERFHSHEDRVLTQHPGYQVSLTRWFLRGYVTRSMMWSAQPGTYSIEGFGESSGLAPVTAIGGKYQTI